MNYSAPHYLLITEAKTISDPYQRNGKWRFVLEQMGFEARIEVADVELDVTGERLELLVVVRGLEALEQPSRVTLITSSRYVGRGIRRSLAQWKMNDWRWERFGTMSLIKNHDLWRRVDHAMNFHQVECRLWDFNSASSKASAKDPADQDQPRRRRNVIRPHRELSGSHRKTFGTPAFGASVVRDRSEADRNGTNEMLTCSVADTLVVAESIRTQSNRTEVNRTEMNGSTEPRLTQRRSHSRHSEAGRLKSVGSANCLGGTTAGSKKPAVTIRQASVISQPGTAPVRPLRAGRAYGYAPN